LVQDTYERFKAGDIRALLQSFSEQVEWQLPTMQNVPFAGTWRGRDGVSQFFSTLASTQDIVEFQPEETIAQGDQVVVLGRFAMRVKSTGKLSVSTWAHVWTIAGGKITRFREYVDTAAVSQAHSSDGAHVGEPPA
jgi:ketosteroid isomerase-like protein